jgi:3-oxoacyl-[acyl-carrier protein] reductase
MKVAIVTGGTSGMGEATARELTKRGWQVAAMARKQAPFQGDVAEDADCRRVAKAVLDKWGRIDALVNNAGIFATLEKRPFDQIPLQQWELVMRVNVTGVFNCVCAVAPVMRQAKWGRIVNISSDSVPLGVANYLHYVTSKSALIGMTNALARELGPSGITVNCIRPGGVATEVDRTSNPTLERRQQQMAQQCVPRSQVPADLVGLTMFLTTPASAFISGQTIACDGGLTHSN